VSLGCTATTCGAPQVCCVSGFGGGGGGGGNISTQCEGTCAAGSYQLCQHSSDCKQPGDRCAGGGGGGGGFRVCVPSEAGVGPFDAGGPPPADAGAGG
jgi:hypothetical protein